MQLDRYGNEPMTECFEHSPVASLVGIGQGRTGYLAANPDVVELGALRVQTSHQIAQALASGELGIGDAEEMVPGREVLDPVVRRESIDQMFEVTNGTKPNNCAKTDWPRFMALPRLPRELATIPGKSRLRFQIVGIWITPKPSSVLDYS